MVRTFHILEVSIHDEEDTDQGGQLARGLPVLTRPSFDAFLWKFYDVDPMSNLSWYALYNAVLASGCRASKMTIAGETPSSFKDSEEEAQQYFKNAFSVHTELIYQRTDLTSVQVGLSYLFVLRYILKRIRHY